jgi:outer membrane protein TolC
VPIPVQPTQEDIARRAYEISQQRQGHGGDALSDWLQAERELTAVS